MNTERAHVSICLAVSTLAFFAVHACLPMMNCFGQQKKPIVLLSDLRAGRVALMGELGAPLGTSLLIEGEWIEVTPPVDGVELKESPQPAFSVHSVNRKRLARPVVYESVDVGVLPTLSRKSYRDSILVGFESARCDGIPVDVWDGGQPLLQDTRKFAIYSRLTLVRENR
jgi:hypothetical protein